MGRTLLSRIRSDERGAGYLAAFIVLFSVLVVAGVGILVDSSRMFSAQRQSSSIALEAARAGANAIDDAALYSNAGFHVDPADAQAAAYSAASAFVSGAGATLDSVDIVGNRVEVVVSAHVDSWFPIMSGRTVVQSAAATAEIGLDGPAGP